jgi:hypothetical protein
MWAKLFDENKLKITFENMLWASVTFKAPTADLI